MASDWVRWTFAVVTAAAAVYHSVRLPVSASRRRPGEMAVDLTHAAMGVAMTVMLAGRLGAGSSRVGAVVFLGALAWFVGVAFWRFVDGGLPYAWHDARQAVLAAAMVFMLATTGTAARAAAGATTGSVAGMPGMTMATPASGAGASHRAAVALLVAVALAAIAFARLVWHRRADHPGAIAPTATASCQFAMSAATVYMLGAMI